MSQGAWVVVVAVLVATAFGLFRAFTDGRFRGTHRVRGAQPGGQAGAQGGGQVGAEPGGPVGPAAQTGDVTEPTSVLHDSGVEGPLGERATLLQFSSAFCAPCRATRRVLADVAAVVPGVTHVEVDAEHHLDLVRRVGVLRTPTTLVLDAHGREVTRASGALRKEQVIAALGQAIPD